MSVDNFNTKYVEEFGTKYIISKEGLLYNTESQKFVAMSTKDNQYKYYHLRINGKTVNRYVHRLIAQAFLENPNNLPEVEHKNRDRANNNIENLCWVSRSQNQRNTNRNNRTTFVSQLPDSCFSFDLYDQHQFKNYYLDENYNLYYKLYDNIYKLINLDKTKKSYSVMDSNNKQTSVSLNKLKKLY